MAQRITGVCASPGATWEPPRAARQLSGSPVSSSMSLSSQTDHIVLWEGYSSNRFFFPCSCMYERRRPHIKQIAFLVLLHTVVVLSCRLFILSLRPEEELWAGPPRHWGTSEWHDCVALSSPRGSACGWGEGFLHFKRVTFFPVLPAEEQPYVLFA